MFSALSMNSLALLACLACFEGFAHLVSLACLVMNGIGHNVMGLGGLAAGTGLLIVKQWDTTFLRVNITRAFFTMHCGKRGKHSVF